MLSQVLNVTGNFYDADATSSLTLSTIVELSLDFTLLALALRVSLCLFQFTRLVAYDNGVNFLNNKCLILLKQKWEYMHSPPSGTPEGKLTEILKNPKDWV